jgi:hypothetical protein
MPTFASPINITEPVENVQLALLHHISVYIEGYVIPVILLLGMCGNALSLAVFIRARKREDAPVQYLSCLAVTDTGVIISLGFVHWMSYGLGYVTDGAFTFNLFTYSRFTCKFVLFFMHVAECTSAWVIMAFSMERALVVWFPLKRSDLTPRKRAITIGCIGLLATLISVHRLVLPDIFVVSSTDADDLVWCWYGTSAFVQLLIWQYDEAFHNYIPCSLIFIANICILVGLHRANRLNIKSSLSKNTVQERRIIFSLMLVSTLYIIFMLPASVSFSYNMYLYSKDTIDPVYLEFIHYLVTFFDEFSMMNFSFNFIIYGCTLPFYRQAVLDMFHFRRTKRIK